MAIAMVTAMAKIALIWQEGINLKVYTFDTQSDRDIIEFCQDAHGHFSLDNDAVKQLKYILANEIYAYSDQGSKHYIYGPISAIYVSGIPSTTPLTDGE